MNHHLNLKTKTTLVGQKTKLLVFSTS